MISEDKIEIIAEVCHDINRAYCKAIGDDVSEPWNVITEKQRNIVRKGVRFIIANPDIDPVDTHNKWMHDKLEDGWVYGIEKDDVQKTHPSLQPYYQLDKSERVKDTLFLNIVKNLMRLNYNKK